MAAQHEMPAEVAVEILGDLQEAGVTATVGGGWGVDALLGEQTRPHWELDLRVPAPDLDRLIVVFVKHGIDRIYPWSGDRPGTSCCTTEGLNASTYTPTSRCPRVSFTGASVAGIPSLSASWLAKVRIIGVPVRCETPESALERHTGYQPRPSDLLDVGHLFDKFRLPVPDGYR